MTLDFSVDGCCIVRMDDYVETILAEAPADMVPGRSQRGTGVEGSGRNLSYPDGKIVIPGQASEARNPDSNCFPMYTHTVN